MMSFEDMISFEDRCTIKYNIDNIISTNLIISHDGCGQFGPESNIYDYNVLFINNNKIYYVNFHREYWYRGKDDEEYEVYDNNIFKRCISDELINKGYYNIDKLPDGVSGILYKPNMLSLKKKINSHKIMDLDQNISLYINFLEKI